MNLRRGKFTHGHINEQAGSGIRVEKLAPEGFLCMNLMIPHPHQHPHHHNYHHHHHPNFHPPPPKLRNVNSFTRSKTLELNFTPRKARKSQQFWDLSETKLTKIIVLENKC